MVHRSGEYCKESLTMLMVRFSDVVPANFRAYRRFRPKRLETGDRALELDGMVAETYT